MKVTVIGAGLAGCEVAWQLAKHGHQVKLYEMKPKMYSPAHKYAGFAELVCSNSLKAMRLQTAAGLLKEEMRLLGSIVMEAADATSVPAGGALAVDRKAFSDYITKKIKAEPLIEIRSEEMTQIPEGPVIIATGPLTSDRFSRAIETLLSTEYLSFYDAAAPIVSFSSLNLDKVFFAARYDCGDPDYINCPFQKEEYEHFYQELIHAERAPVHDFDVNDPKVYEGCMPVEIMASRGEDTLRYGPLKPVGLRDPHTGKRPYAVVQLRKENNDGTMYNLVGFQTNLKFPEQKRVFSLIPGLENAEFIRYGVMHRNTFINAPKLLTPYYALRENNNIFFAGQITGVEGYIESAASGIVAGMNMCRVLEKKEPIIFPRKTMIGALAHYISDITVTNFQPMGCNMGILPGLDTQIKNKQERYAALAKRAIEFLKTTIDGVNI